MSSRLVAANPARANAWVAAARTCSRRSARRRRRTGASAAGRFARWPLAGMPSPPSDLVDTRVYNWHGDSRMYNLEYTSAGGGTRARRHHRRRGVRQGLRQGPRAGRPHPYRPAWRHLRPARPQRRRQDHPHPRAHHPAGARCRQRPRRRRRRPRRPGRRARPYRPGGPVRRRRRGPHRPGERRDGRPPVRPAAPRGTALRPGGARAHPPRGRRRPAGEDLLGWDAPPAGPGRVAGRPPPGAVPRRAHGRPGPGQPPRPLGADRRPGRHRQAAQGPGRRRRRRAARASQRPPTDAGGAAGRRHGPDRRRAHRQDRAGRAGRPADPDRGAAPPGRPGHQPRRRDPAQADPRRRVPRPDRPPGRPERQRPGPPRQGRPPSPGPTRGGNPMSTVTATIPRRPTGLRRTASDTAVVTRRNLVRTIRLPEVLLTSSTMPVVFILMFTYVFGGAVQAALPPAAAGRYANWLVPGLLAQFALFGGVATASGLAEDLASGVIDRFRSLPMARSAVLAGRTLADLVRSVVTLTLMLAVGLAIGFRWQTSLLGLLAGLAVVVAFGYAWSWVMALLGLVVRTAEAVQAAAYVGVFPLAFTSSVFVPTQTMPGWLQAFAANQPLTVATNALRGLLLGPGALHPGQTVAGQVVLALIWSAAILAVAAPLAVRRYRRTVS